MIFETHTVSPQLQPHVESVFHFKHFQPDHSIERVVPTGHLFIVLALDGMQRHTYDNQSLTVNATFHNAWVSGIHRNYLSISAHPDSEMFVIQFSAFGARPFFHLPMEALAEKVVPAEDTLDGAILTLKRHIQDAVTSQEKFSVADAWLQARFKPDLAAPQTIIEIIERLKSEPGARLSEVVDSYFGTQKHLISQFKKFVGLTPKQFHRVLRFNDVLAQMQDDQFLSWADIAHRCGYSDQSHFIREFTHFCGFRPRVFAAEELDRDGTNFFALDRRG